MITQINKETVNKTTKQQTTKSTTTTQKQKPFTPEEEKRFLSFVQEVFPSSPLPL